MVVLESAQDALELGVIIWFGKGKRIIQRFSGCQTAKVMGSISIEMPIAFALGTAGSVAIYLNVQ
jgi:hypothetical protein